MVLRVVDVRLRQITEYEVPEKYHEDIKFLHKKYIRLKRMPDFMSEALVAKIHEDVQPIPPVSGVYEVWFDDTTPRPAG